MIKFVILWLLALLFTANSLSITFRSNFNFGTVLLWGSSVALILYNIFHKSIDQFCSAGLGLVLKILFFAGLSIFGCLFLFVTFSGLASTGKYDEKVIIILGAGIRKEKVGDLLRRRLEKALEVFRRNPQAVLVVTGGQGHGEDISEALAMRRWLVEKGVPEEKILVEDQSKSTEQNFQFAKRILEENGVSTDGPLGVVTSYFHCYRSRKYARQAGFADVRTFPASVHCTVLLPSTMREVFALLFLWVFR